MKTTNANVSDRKLAYVSPYDVEPAPEVHNPVVRVGMSVAEMIAWLVVMAALSLGMILLLWNVSR